MHYFACRLHMKLRQSMHLSSVLVLCSQYDYGKQEATTNYVRPCALPQSTSALYERECGLHAPTQLHLLRHGVSSASGRLTKQLA